MDIYNYNYESFQGNFSFAEEDSNLNQDFVIVNNCLVRLVTQFLFSINSFVRNEIIRIRIQRQSVDDKIEFLTNVLNTNPHDFTPPGKTID